jgi:hypothetical protein
MIRLWIVPMTAKLNSSLSVCEPERIGLETGGISQSSAALVFDCARSLARAHRRCGLPSLLPSWFLLPSSDHAGRLRIERHHGFK